MTFARSWSSVVVSVAIILALTACAANDGGANAPGTDATEEPEGTVMTLYVGPELVDCEGVAPQKCMQVKESPDGEWQLFYDRIEGFDYEPGYEYELRVLVEDVPSPPADASSLRYTLVEVVSKTPVETGTEPEGGMKEWPLEGTRWVLSAYGDPADPTAALPGTEVTATFDDAEGKVSGNATCNGYFGGYEVSGDQLTIGDLGATMMACPGEGRMEQERAFLAAMGAPESFAIEGDTLRIAYEGDQVLSFTASVPIALEGTAWDVISYNNGKEAVVSLIIGSEITALFEDGNLSGSAGCNTYNAAYELVGEDGISIGPAATTRMMCPEPEGVMEQESQFLAALEMADVYRVDGDRLELRTSEGSLVVSATAAP